MKVSSRYPIRRNTVIDETSNSAGQGSGFPAAGSGDNKQRPFIVEHGHPLLVVEAL